MIELETVAIQTLSNLTLFGVLIGVSQWLSSYISRKLISDLQARVGPSRVGPYGLLQGPADFLKLAFKQDGSHTLRYREWIWIFFSGLLMLLGIFMLPGFVLIDSPVAVLLPVVLVYAAWVVSSFDLLLSGTDAGWIFYVRRVFQMTAALVPLLLSLLAVGAWTGGLSWALVELHQGPLPHEWLLVRGTGVISFVLYFASCSLFLGVGAFGDSRKPQSHWSASSWVNVWRQILIYVGEFVCIYLGVLLFLGGPEQIKGVNYLFVIVVTVVIHLVAAVVPKLSLSQSAGLNWRLLLPLSIVNFLVSNLWAMYLLDR
jgi:NADH-quinone oxidoreductase subunit H